MKNPPSYISAMILGGLVAAVTLPVSRTVKIPAVVEPASYKRLFPIIPAMVKSIAIRDGQKVRAGDVVAVFENPGLDHDIRKNAISIAILKARMDRAIADSADKAGLMVLERQLAARQTRRAGLLKEKAQLVLRAPFDGRLRDVDINMHKGRWVKRTSLVAVLVAEQKRVVRGYVSEADLWRIASGAKGAFVPDDLQQDKQPVTITAINYSSSPLVTIPYLASVYGGPVAVRSDVKNRLFATGAQYLVTMSIAGHPGADVAPVTRGLVQMQGRPESLMAQAWRQTLKVLVRESGV